MPHTQQAVRTSPSKKMEGRWRASAIQPRGDLNSPHPGGGGGPFQALSTAVSAPAPRASTMLDRVSGGVCQRVGPQLCSLGRNSTNTARLGLSTSGICGTKKNQSAKHFSLAFPSPCKTTTYVRKTFEGRHLHSSDHPTMTQLWSPTSATHPGRRFAQVIKLKPECVAQYKEVHAAIWPEVAKQIRECNIQDCWCFPSPFRFHSLYP